MPPPKAKIDLHIMLSVFFTSVDPTRSTGWSHNNLHLAIHVNGCVYQRIIFGGKIRSMKSFVFLLFSIVSTLSEGATECEYSIGH